MCVTNKENQKRFVVDDYVFSINIIRYDLFIKRYQNHFFYELALPLAQGFEGGMYLGKLPLSKYDQYISAVQITNFPFFYFPYSTGVNETKKFVPLLPNLASWPYLGSTENSWAKY